MKKITVVLLFLFLQLSQSAFSQTDSQFQKGFYEGYEATLNDSGIIGKYLEYADYRKCDLKAPYYANDKMANEKIYADGYRCGVSQASKASVLIKNSFGSNGTKHNNSSINDIRKDIDELKSKIKKGLSPEQEAALNAQIFALEGQESNLTIAKNYAEQEKRDAVERNENNISAYNNQIKENQQRDNNIQQMQNLKVRQDQARENLYQNTSNMLNSLSNSMQNLAVMQVRNELSRRQNLANNFANSNSNKINKLIAIYNQIPKANFKKKLTGIFKAHLLIEKNYSFSNNQDLFTETECFVNIDNDIIKNIYLYGKKSFEIDLPSKFPENSTINNGVVKYVDYDNLETSNIIIIEPYLNSKATKPSLAENGVGYLTIWSSDKDYEGKTIYVQELDKKKNLIREITTKIVYSKNSKEAESNQNLPKFGFNTENDFLFLGEVTSTPYGSFSLFPKISNDNKKALKEDEHRFVEIKKYRE